MSHPMDHLWKDLFADGGQAWAMASVRKALKERRRRMVAKSLAGFSTLVACAGVLWLALPLLNFSRNPPSFREELGKLNIPTHSSPGESTGLAQGDPTPAKPGGLVAPALPGVRFISDNELLERFRGYPVALVGPPENRRLIFTSSPTQPQGYQEQPEDIDPGTPEEER